MPIPTPRGNETEEHFLGRCMSDAMMTDEYPNQGQRLAICNQQWSSRGKSVSKVATPGYISVLGNGDWRGEQRIELFIKESPDIAVETRRSIFEMLQKFFEGQEMDAILDPIGPRGPHVAVFDLVQVDDQEILVKARAYEGEQLRGELFKGIEPGSSPGCYYVTKVEAVEEHGVYDKLRLHAVPCCVCGEPCGGEVVCPCHVAPDTDTCEPAYAEPTMAKAYAVGDNVLCYEDPRGRVTVLAHDEMEPYSPELIKQVRAEALAKHHFTHLDLVRQLHGKNVWRVNRIGAPVYQVGARPGQEVQEGVHKGLDFDYEPMQKDAAKQYTFGPCYLASDDQRDPTLDAHNEFIMASELQEGQWEYVRSGDRNLYLQHGMTREGMQKIGEWVDLVAWPYEVQAELRLPGVQKGKTNKVTIPAGSVWMGVLWNEEGWALVKAGKIRGLSMGGTAKRREIKWAPRTPGKK